MATFEELRDRALDLAQAGVAKAKELTDIAKINLANSAEEDAIKKAYAEIGKLYYAERGMAPDEAYVVLCQKITDSKAKIEENKAKIAAMKAQSEVQDAPCGHCSVETEVPPEEPIEPQEEPCSEAESRE